MPDINNKQTKSKSSTQFYWALQQCVEITPFPLETKRNGECKAKPF